MCLSILRGSVHLYLSVANILKEEICHFVYQHRITYQKLFENYIYWLGAIQNFLPLVTILLSSNDELANHFQNCNQRVCNGDHSP